MRTGTGGLRRPRPGLTVGEHARRGQFDVGQGAQVVQHGTAIAIFLGIVHKGSDVLLLTVIGNSRADDHGDIIYRGEKQILVYPRRSDTLNGHSGTSLARKQRKLNIHLFTQFSGKRCVSLLAGVVSITFSMGKGQFLKFPIRHGHTL